MLQKAIISIFLSVGILLSGCTAIEIREANNELVNLYSAKIAAVNAKDTEQERTAKSALSILAKDAFNQCKKEKDVRNKVSYCRVAATAEWLSGGKKVKEYADTGKLLCENKEYNLPPRDCSLLDIIPNLAAIDEIAGTIDDINIREEHEQKDPGRDEVISLFVNLRIMLNDLFAKRGEVSQKNTDPKLVQRIDRHIGKIICSHLLNTLGLAVEHIGDGSEFHQKVDCYNYKVQKKAKALKYSKDIAFCIPSGVIIKPEGCVE